MDPPSATSMSDADRESNRRRRSATRLAAVQALYEMEVSGAPADPVLGEFIGKRWKNTPAGLGQNYIHHLLPSGQTKGIRSFPLSLLY